MLHTVRSTRARRRGAALAALTLGLTSFGGPAKAAQTADAPPPRAGVGGLASGAPRTPPAPQRSTSAGLRPLTPAERARLTTGAAHGGATCDIDFDDDTAISFLPDHASTTFALSPWWNQVCGGNYAHVFPTDESHFHLGYVDGTIGPCPEPENPYDTPVGEFSRGDDCEPIDPLTEPRSDIFTHYPWNHTHLDLYDPSSPGYAQRPFTLERARLLQAPVRVCYRMPPTGPWIAAAPVGPFDHPGLVYCWANLAPGLWDLSGWTSGTVEVSFTGAVGDVWGLDDLRLG